MEPSQSRVGFVTHVQPDAALFTLWSDTNVLLLEIFQPGVIKVLTLKKTKKTGLKYIIKPHEIFYILEDSLDE